MKRIYLYLFVFSFAINVFQYVNDSNVLKQKDKEIESLTKKIQKQQDTINKLKLIETTIQNHEE